jgi:hypothetical protein
MIDMKRKYDRKDIKDTNITEEMILSMMNKKYESKKEKEKLRKKHPEAVSTIMEIMSLDNNKSFDSNIREALSFKSNFPNFYDQLFSLIIDTIGEHILEETGKKILRRSQADALYLAQGYLCNYQFCKIIISVLGLQKNINIKKQERNNNEKKYLGLVSVDYNEARTEKEHTEFLLKHSRILMNPNTYVFNSEKKIDTRIADLIIYNEENKTLYIVEMERICHNFIGHTIPQIGDLVRATMTNNRPGSFHKVLELVNNSNEDSLGRIITDQIRGEISKAITKGNIKICVIFDKIKNDDEEQKIKSIKDIYFSTSKDKLELYYPNTNSLMAMNSY